MTCGNLGRGVIGSTGAAFSAAPGLAGGIVKVPLMNLGMGVPLRVATATSNLMIGITAAASAFIYLSAGDRTAPARRPSASSSGRHVGRSRRPPGDRSCGAVSSCVHASCSSERSRERPMPGGLDAGPAARVDRRPIATELVGRSSTSPWICGRGARRDLAVRRRAHIRPGAIVRDILALEPTGFLWLGLAFVIATPISRVIVALVTYARTGDRLMVAVSVGILLVITVGIVIAAAGGA